MENEIDGDLERARLEGVTIYASQNMLRYVDGILTDQDVWLDKWLDQSDKDILINLKRGLLKVGENLIPLNRYL
jgi:hypothetical protein